MVLLKIILNGYTKMRLFICGAKPEYEYIKEKFGYPDGYVKYTGLSRFDNLHNFKVKENQILVMPTWRRWLDNKIIEKKEFLNTEYFKKWSEFLKDKEIQNMLEKNNLKLIFYPHNNIKKVINQFKINNSNIIIASNKIYDVQTLLMESVFLITDYSSIFMDFAYMKKPMIFYQFDKKEYREKHLQEGYFSYEKDGFGEVIEELSTLKLVLEEYIKNNFKIKKEYLKKEQIFFEINDKNNSERNYKEIKKI